MVTVPVLCVNFNSVEHTIAWCNSLARQAGFGSEFGLRGIVVNNSTDHADTAALHDHCRGLGWVSVLDCPENPGYFGGLNRGLELIARRDRSPVVIGNNDLEFHEEFVRRLLGRKYPQRVHVICPDVVTRDGRHQNPHVARRISRFRRLQFDAYFSHYYAACCLNLLRRHVLKRRPRNEVLTEGEIHMGVGACYILLPSFFEHSRTLEYPAYLYGEEAFLSDQVHRTGGAMWFDPSLHVKHAESATLSRLPPRHAYEFARAGYPLYRNLL